MGTQKGQKMAAVLGTLRSTPPSNSNEECGVLRTKDFYVLL
jgi:hypothetical protein